MQDICKLKGTQKVSGKDVDRGGKLRGFFGMQQRDSSEALKKKDVLRDQRSKLATKAIEYGGNTQENECFTQQKTGGKDLLGM
jgi:hypothetical protein